VFSVCIKIQSQKLEEKGEKLLLCGPNLPPKNMISKMQEGGSFKAAMSLGDREGKGNAAHIG